MTNVYPFTGEYMDKGELGNKGNNLVAMTRLGLPVPPGFIVAVNAFKRWQATGAIPEQDILLALSMLEFKMGKKLGQGLEVSVRSSAAASMPGMMDTILNISDLAIMLRAVKRIFESWSNPRAIDYRRLWAQQLLYRQWFLAIGMSDLAQELYFPVIREPEKKVSMVSI
jgi:pyruvate, orthophosphate dikinase